MRIKKRIVLLIGALLLILVTTWLLYNVSKCRATLTGDGNLRFDGYTYSCVDFREIGDYTETYHLICRTDFSGGWRVYKIEEYPDGEYVAVRAARDAELYKRTN